MPTHEFTLVLDRAPTDDEIDTLYEVGLDDAAPEIDHGSAVLHVHRDAARLAEALVSSIADVERAGFTVAAIRSEDLVTLPDIAARTGRSYESLRLLATGKRGPGGFPPAWTSGSWSLYSWQQVSRWLHAYDPTVFTPSTYEREIAAADYIVRARTMLADDDDRDVFRQLIGA